MAKYGAKMVNVCIPLFYIVLKLFLMTDINTTKIRQFVQRKTRLPSLNFIVIHPMSLDVFGKFQVYHPQSNATCIRKL